jgi:hypothetical protein
MVWDHIRLAAAICNDTSSLGFPFPRVGALLTTPFPSVSLPSAMGVHFSIAQRRVFRVYWCKLKNPRLQRGSSRPGWRWRGYDNMVAQSRHPVKGGVFPHMDEVNRKAILRAAVLLASYPPCRWTHIWGDTCGFGKFVCIWHSICAISC